MALLSGQISRAESLCSKFESLAGISCFSCQILKALDTFESYESVEERGIQIVRKACDVVNADQDI